MTESIKLTESITKNCKVKLVNYVFEFKKNPNDECNVFIESEGTTDIDEIFDQLIKKHKEFIEPLKDTGFVPKGT